MRPVRWLLVAVAVLPLAGCGQTHRQAHASTLHLTEKDNGKSFAVKLNETVVFTFPSNRSTGYGRTGEPPTGDGKSGLRFVSHRYIAPKKPIPGAAGREIWRYRAVANGIHPVGFLYLRPRHGPFSQALGFTIRVR